MTLADLASAVEAAYASRDPAAFGTLLDEQVRWGNQDETPETCHSRAEVLRRMQARMDRGVDVHVHGATTADDAILLELHVVAPVAGGFARERPVYQVLRVRDGLIVEIRGYSTRAEAAVQAGISDVSLGQPRSVTPILNVSDLGASFEWFAKLGWAKKWDWQDATGTASFGAVGSDEAEVFLSLNGQGQPGMWLSVWVDDVDAVHRVCIAEGLDVLRPPRDEAWGVREMHLRHPDGHVLRVSQTSP